MARRECADASRQLRDGDAASRLQYRSARPFLIAAGQKSDSATLYAIDAESGALKVLKRYPLGKNPNWVEIIDLP
jgi:6-phosphogluconolactonase (cycloisomerase 2 family)